MNPALYINFAIPHKSYSIVHEVLPRVDFGVIYQTHYKTYDSIHVVHGVAKSRFWCHIISDPPLDFLGHNE